MKRVILLFAVILIPLSIFTADQLHAQNEDEEKLEEITSLEDAFEDESLLQVIKEEVASNGYSLTEEALQEITTLGKVRERGIKSLKGIELLTGLKELDMRSNEISDLSPLASLGKLESIDLRDNNLSSLAGIEELINVKELDVRGNNVESLEPLKNILSLEALDLRDNSITDIQPLEGLVNVKELNLRNNGITDISPLANLKQLVSLNLHSNQVSDLTPLTNLTKIEELILRRNQISDITPLQNLVVLADLNIRDNNITDLSPLKDLEHLRVRLNLDGNSGIKDFSPIAHYYDEIEDVDFVLPDRSVIDITELNPLTGEGRKEMIRDYIIASNQHITDSSIRETKFNQLATGPFAFYRGTASLFFQDVKEQVIEIPDSWSVLNQKNTWITGDLHIENIGFYGNRNKEAIFELNDFDEVAIAPFYFDLLNYGTSLYLLNDAGPQLQLGQEDIVEMVVKYGGYYRQAISNVANGSVDVKLHYFTKDNLDGFIGDFAKEVSEEPTNNQLTTWTTIMDNRVFDQTNNRLAEVTEAEWQQITTNWDSYVNSLDEEILTTVGKDYFIIKDIARRINAGLGSLGYDRYYVLIESETDSATDDIILDVKAQGPSAVEASGLFDSSAFPTHASRTIAGVHALHNYPDIHWGTLETENQSFLVKERSPFKDEVGPVDFGGIDDLDNFIKASAEATAYSHSRAAIELGDSSFATDLSAIFATELSSFDEQLADITLKYYAQVIEDHKLFASLHHENAFDNINDDHNEEREEENKNDGNHTVPGDNSKNKDLVNNTKDDQKKKSQKNDEKSNKGDAKINDPEKISEYEQVSQDNEHLLPKTATSMFNYLLAGIILLILGVLLVLVYKRKNTEISH